MSSPPRAPLPEFLFEWFIHARISRWMKWKSTQRCEALSVFLFKAINVMDWSETFLSLWNFYFLFSFRGGLLAVASLMDGLVITTQYWYYDSKGFVKNKQIWINLKLFTKKIAITSAVTSYSFLKSSEGLFFDKILNSCHKNKSKKKSPDIATRDHGQLTFTTSAETSNWDGLSFSWKVCHRAICNGTSVDRVTTNKLRWQFIEKHWWSLWTLLIVWH